MRKLLYRFLIDALDQIQYEVSEYSADVEILHRAAMLLRGYEEEDDPQRHYYVYFRQSRRHRWVSVEDYWSRGPRLDHYRVLLSATLREEGVTPGYGIIEDSSSLFLMSMAKSTFLSRSEDKRWIVE